MTPSRCRLFEVTAFKPFPREHPPTWDECAALPWDDDYQTALSESMCSDGWIGGPVEVCDGLVWDGHHRLITALVLGWDGATPIPVVYATREWLAAHGHDEYLSAASGDAPAAGA